MQDVVGTAYRTLYPGYGIENASYRPRHALLRLKDGRLLSGSGGDIEVVHPIELERSQHTGLPVRVTVIRLFGGLDTVKGMQQLEGTDHVIVYGTRHAAIIHGAELFEGTVVAAERILALPSTVVAVNVEKQTKTELLVTLLLETGLFHYSISLDDGCHYECLLCYKCNRPIQSGILWRDGGALHVAYYDGYIRVGVANEDYDDMILVKKISASRHNLGSLMDILCDEVTRLTDFEENEKDKRADMLQKIRVLKDTAPPSPPTNPAEEEGLSTAYADFLQLKMSFRNHSIRAERISHRLISLRQLLSLVCNAIDTSNSIDKSLEDLTTELTELHEVSLIYDECLDSNNIHLIEKSRSVMERKKYEVEDLLRKCKSNEMDALLAGWDKKISDIISQLTGQGDVPKDMRNMLCHSIFEHRPERTDRFSHFLLDHTARDLTLYCMSGISTIAVYPRKCIRVASISLDQSYSTSLTSTCLMTSSEGVYVADDKGVFPIYFYRHRTKGSPSVRDKRYFDAGNPVALPPFDHITSILMEKDGLIVGSLSGGLLHLSFDPSRKFEHVIVASCLMAHPFSHGPLNDVIVLAAGESHLSVHASTMEVAISERDSDRWHRVTSHSGGAHSLAVTPFSMEHRGAFLIAASTHYVRIKALQYTEDSLVGLHDLAESRVTDEGKPVEVLMVSMDPSMEFRPLPCKLRYAVGYGDKAIRTYVALLSGDHDFAVAEKFIAQIEPLHNISQMICFHGRPMGCYASNAKTLQVWNDLDRHQQKKMKSERMELHRMEIGITSLERVEGRSSYVLVGFKDNRIDIYEERGRGTGKIEKAGTVERERMSVAIRTRISATSCGDRLFIHSLNQGSIDIHTVLLEAGRVVQSSFLLTSLVPLHSAHSLRLLPHKPHEFVLFGDGIEVHQLTAEQRRIVDNFRDFEF